ncbi:hypothetical protein D3C77_602620 [compost metagenome]
MRARSLNSMGMSIQKVRVKLTASGNSSCRRGSASAENAGRMAIPAPIATASCWASRLVLRRPMERASAMPSRNSSSLLNSRSST